MQLGAWQWPAAYIKLIPLYCLVSPQQLGLVLTSQSCIMSDTLKWAVISCTQCSAGVPGSHLGMSYSPRGWWGHVSEVKLSLTCVGLCLVVHPQEVLVRGRAVVWGRAVGLVVEPELHLIAEDLLGRSLGLVEQQVLVVTAGQTSLIGVHPTCWVLLLDEVTSTGPTAYWSVYNELPLGSSRQSLWKGTPLRVPLMPPSQTQVGLSRTDIFRVPPDLSLGPW